MNTKVTLKNIKPLTRADKLLENLSDWKHKPIDYPAYFESKFSDKLVKFDNTQR